jgi:hypothetical protein
MADNFATCSPRGRYSYPGRYMENNWHVARDGQAYGPYSEVEMRLFADSGQFQPTDFVFRFGSKEWQPVSVVFRLAGQCESPPLAELVELRSIQTTCFSCFADVTVSVEGKARSGVCPNCRGEIAVEPPPQSPDLGPQQAFAGMGGDLTERIQQKMAEAYAAEQAENKAVLGIFRGLGRIGLDGLE